MIRLYKRSLRLAAPPSSAGTRLIYLFVLPPRSPKLNRGVEHYNQTIQDVFFLPYYNTLPTQVNALNLKLQEGSFYYNKTP